MGMVIQKQSDDVANGQQCPTVTASNQIGEALQRSGNKWSNLFSVHPCTLNPMAPVRENKGEMQCCADARQANISSVLQLDPIAVPNELAQRWGAVQGRILF